MSITHETEPLLNLTKHADKNPQRIWHWSLYAIGALIFVSGLVSVYINSEIDDRHETLNALQEDWANFSEARNAALSVSSQLYFDARFAIVGAHDAANNIQLQDAIADFDSALGHLGALAATIGRPEAARGLLQASSRFIRSGFALSDFSRRAIATNFGVDSSRQGTLLNQLAGVQRQFLAEHGALTREQAQIRREQETSALASADSLRAVESSTHIGVIFLIGLIVVFAHRVARANAALEAQRRIDTERLRESEEHFRTLVKNVPGITFRLRVAPDWPVEYISESVELYTGFPASDYVKGIRPSASGFHPEDLPQAKKALTAAVEAKTAYQVEYRLRHTDGRITWMLERGQVICDDGGNPAFVDGIILDIDEAKAAAESLRQSSARLAALLDAHPGPAMLIERGGTIEAANRGVAELLNRPLAQIVGRRGVSLLPLEVGEQLAIAIERAFADNEPTDLTLEWRQRATRVSVRPICEPQSARNLVAVFGHDITKLLETERALRESEKLLRDTTSGIPGVVFQCRLESDGRLTFPMISPGLDGVYGITADECKKDPEAFFRLIHPDDLESVMGSIWKAISERNSWLGEFRVKSGDEARWVRAQSTPLRQHDGRMVWNGVLSDITDQKKLEEQLVESEERYRELVDHQDDGVCLIDIDGRFVVANPAADRIFGVAAGTLVGRKTSEFIEEERLLELRRERDRLLKQGRARFETWITRPNGDKRYLALSTSPRFDYSGQLIGFFYVARDITELRAAQQAVQESEARFRLLAEHATDIITRCSAEARINYASPAVTTILGWTPEELIGRSLFEFTHPDDAELVKTNVSETIEMSKTITSVARFRHRDGHYVWLESCARAADNSEFGQAPDIIAVSRDVSERVRADEERARLVNILEATSDVVLITDSQDRLLYLNQSGRALLGFEQADEADGTCIEEFFSAASLQKLRASAIPAAIRDGIWIGESAVRRREGSEFTVSHVMIARLDEHGKLVCLSSIMRDLTERLKIESEVRESLVQIHTLIEAAADGIITFRADGTIESANPAAERIFALSQVRLMLRSFFSLLAEPLRTTLEARLAAPFPNDQSPTVLVREAVAIRDSNTVFSIELAISRMNLESGTRYVAFIRDISERKAAEQKIVESDARLRAILSSAADGIVVTNAAGIIQITNAAASQIFGLDQGLTSGSIQDLVPALDSRALLEIKDSRSFEGVGRCANGREIPVQLSISRVQIGEDHTFTLIVRDLTDEFERRQRLQEADRFTSIGTLAAGIAHEFKNYLAGIIGNASFAQDLLDEPGGLEEARLAFAQILEAGEKANEIAMSLLSYSSHRSDSDGPVLLTDIIHSTLRFVRKELNERNIELQTDFAEVPSVNGSAGRLQQVVLNLVMNAAQAMNNGGTLTLRVSCDQAWVRLQVADTGIGIPAENLGRIFDPFFSTKGVWGRDSDYGTGLGLSLCRNIVTAYGGTITVESELGKGSVFTVQLPASTNDAPIEKVDCSRLPVGRLLIFSADLKTTRDYEFEGQSLGLDVSVVQSCDELPAGANQPALCIADGRTPFKVELRRLFDRCRELGIKVVLINAGACGDCRLELQAAADLVVDSNPGVEFLLRQGRLELHPIP